MEKTDSSSSELFTRDEVFGGLPAKRAATLLFLIESRTAHLVDQSRRAMDFFLPEEVAKERELAFVEAFNLGREPPIRPTIQDIERYAAQWAALVPDNAGLQAAIAHLLGQKYKFTRRAIPETRAALGLDTDSVQQAYRRLYRSHIDTVFAPQVSVIGQAAWSWTALSKWVDSLPPFWITFALTVAFSFSQAFLALPTGIARIGPLTGTLLVVGIGLINVLTIACMVEACARSGDFRYGRAFIGRLVSDYLGSEASIFFSVIAAVRTFLVLLAGSVGIGLTLAPVTGVSAEIWVAVLLLGELYYLSRKSLKITVVTMLLLISSNVLIFLPIVALAFFHAQPANLYGIGLSPLDGENFQPEVLQLVFGVIVMLYIGHVYVVQCAKIVLPRDPSARSLIRGSIAGTVCLVALFTLWMLAVRVAVEPGQLANEAGTALTPLAEQIGPSVSILGSLLVILLLGMSCLRSSTVLFNLVQERIPLRPRSAITLPRRRASLLLKRRGTFVGNPHLGLTYLGLTNGQPHFRLDIQWSGNLHRTEMSFAKNWEVSSLFDQLPDLRPLGVSLALEILQAAPDSVRLQVTSAMSLSYEGQWDASGLHVADAMTLRDPLRQLVNWMTRRGEVSPAEVAGFIGGEERMARTMLEELVEQNFVESLEREAGPLYRVHLAARQGRRLSHEIWEALGETARDPATGRHGARAMGPYTATLRAREWALSEPGRLFLCTSPVLLVFLLAEWLILNQAASFAGILGFGGVIANSLTAGIFPVLLLMSSRRKGDLAPAVAHWVLDHPIFTTAVYLLFLGNLLVHGLFIWSAPWARGTALLVGVSVIAVTVIMIRRGAFARRVVVELRGDDNDKKAASFSISVGGLPQSSDVRFILTHGEESCQAASGAVPSFDQLRAAVFNLPPTPARELKVWTHTITPEGHSESLPARLEVRCENRTTEYDLKLSGGHVVVPLTSAPCTVKVMLAGSSDSARPEGG